MTDQNDSRRRRARPVFSPVSPDISQHQQKAFKLMRQKKQDGHSMPHMNRFSTIARIVGALTAAALLALAAAPQAMAENFDDIDITPANDTKKPGLFSVTYAFKVDKDNDGDTGDEDAVPVTGFTTSGVTTGGNGVVQSVVRNTSTNVYTVSIQANSGFGVNADGTKNDETMTVTLTAGAANYSYTSGGTTTNYTNTQQETRVVVDQSKPTVTIAATHVDDDDGSDSETDDTVNGKFRLHFTFTEVVTGFTSSDISTPNATKSNFRTATNGDSGTVYTVDVLPNTTFNGDLKATIAGGNVSDEVGNLIDKAEWPVTVDQTKPTATIIGPSEWGGTTFTVNITFSEAVTGLATGDFEVSKTKSVADPTPDNGTDDATYVADATVSNVDGNGRNWTAQVRARQAANSDDDTTPLLDESKAFKGAMTLKIKANAVHDLAGIGTDNGNSNTASATKTVTIDAARPTARITAFSPTHSADNIDIDLSAATQTTFTAKIAFSEEVIGFQQGGNDIYVTYGTSTTKNYGHVTLEGELPGGIVVGNNQTDKPFTATVTPTANYEGDMTIHIPANAAQSNADNTKGNPAFSQTVTVSQGAPTATIALDKSRTNGTVTATATFSEPVTGFERDSSDPDVGDFVVTYNNGNTELSDEVSDYTVIGPTTTYKGDAYATGFSVTVTLPDDADDNDTIVFDIVSGAATDIVGNSIVADSNTGQVTLTPQALRTSTVDKTAPTITINAPGSAKGAFDATFTFSENIDEKSFTANDITVANGTVGTVTGSESTYNATITPTTGFNGTLTINVAANRATDIAGNGNEAYDSDTSTTDVDDPWSVTIDQKAPIVVLTPESTQENGAFTVTAKFYTDSIKEENLESVTGLTADDFEVPIIDNGRADDTTTTDVDESKTAQARVSNVSGGGSTWTATITPRAAASDIDTTPNVDESKAFNGNLTVKIKADAAIDTAGNGNTASNTATVNINTVKPTVTISTTKKDYNDDFTATFTFDKWVTGFDASDITVANGSIDTDYNTGGFTSGFKKDSAMTTYNARIKLNSATQNNTINISVAANKATDAHGNQNVASDADAADGIQLYAVTIDTTAPVPRVDGVVAADGLWKIGTLDEFSAGADLELTVRFKNGTANNASDEEVVDLTTADFTVKHVNVTRVENDNATPDDPSDDPNPTDTEDTTETNGGATVKSVVPSPSETDHTYTVTLTPDAFSSTSTVTDGTTPANSKVTTTTKYRRKLRIYFAAGTNEAPKVKDKAGNHNVILPDQNTAEAEAQNYITITLNPGIPSITIEPVLSRTAFSGNKLSDGQPFTVRFTSTQDLTVFDASDIMLTVAGSETTPAPTLTNFSGTGKNYTATIKPNLRVVDDDDNVTNVGHTGNLTISIAADFNNLGNVASSEIVYVDQDTPLITDFTGPYLENEDGTVASDVTSPARLDGSAFYVKLRTDEEVENLSAANFVIYEVGDTKEVKTSVGTATEFTGDDPVMDGDLQNWDVKIQPKSTFSGNMAIQVKAGAGTDRAGRAVALSESFSGPDPTSPDKDDTLDVDDNSDPIIVIDQEAPVPLITFTATDHGNRLDSDNKEITHNVIPGSADTFDVKIRLKDGSRTTGTGSAKMPIFEQVEPGTTQDPNFTAGDIVVSPKGAGVVTSLTREDQDSNITGGSPNIWTATITPTADTDPDTANNQPWEGTITLSIAANKFKDRVGNDNDASNSFTAVIDKTGPKLKSITQSVAVAPGLPFELEFEFNEAVKVTDQDNDNVEDQNELDAILTVAGYNGTLATATSNNWTPQDSSGYDITVTRVAGSQTKFKAVITIDDSGDFDAGDGTDLNNVAVFAKANGVTDVAETGNTASFNVNDQYDPDDEDDEPDVVFSSALDKTSVFVTISSETPYDTVNPTRYGFKFQFTTGVTGFDPSDFNDKYEDGVQVGGVINGGLVSGSLTQEFSAGNITRTAQPGVYYARFTANGEGDLIIMLPAGAAEDAAKNKSFAAEHRLDLGRPKPTIHVVKQDSNNNWVEDTSPALNGNFHIEVRFNEDVDFGDINDRLGENDEDLPIAVNGGIETADPEDSNRDDLRDWLDEDGEKVGDQASSSTIGRTYRTQIQPSEFLGGKADFTLTIGLAANAIRDTSSAKNGNKLVQKTVQIDQTKPTVTITPDKIGNSSAENITVTFTYDELVNGFAESDITPLDGGRLTANSLVRKLKNGTVVTDTTMPAEVHTVVIDTNAGVTEVSFALAAGVVTDVAGNLSAAYDGDSEEDGDQPHTISVDTVRPEPRITGPAADKYGAGPFLVNIAFSDNWSADPAVGEAVTGFILSDLMITGGTPSNFVDISAGTTAEPKGSKYQVQITPPTSPATVSKVTVALAENKATDGAGNLSKAYDNDTDTAGNQPYEATFDSTLPYVSSIAAPVAAKTDFPITVNFNEAVTGFAADDMEITGGTVKDNVVTTLTSSSYRMTIVPDPAVPDNPATTDVDEYKAAFEDNLGISVKAGAATSFANTSKTTVASATTFVRIDLTSPTVATFTLNNGQPLSIGQFNFLVSITFNEDILPSTWAAGDLTVTGGSVVAGSLTANNRTVTARINSPQQNATVSLGLNKVTDLVGNGNAAHDGGSVALGSGADTDKPIPSIIVVDGNYTRNSSPFQIQITFNKAIYHNDNIEDLREFVVGDLSVTRGTAGQFTRVSGQIYTAVITPAATSQNPNVQIQVPANVARSVVGNYLNVASGTTTVSISTSSRTVSVTSSAQAPVPSNATFDVNISFSENTTGFGTGDITVLNGYVVSVTHVSLSRNWVAKIMPTGPEVSVYLVQNVVNGGNAPSNTFKIRSQATSPTPATLQVSLTAPPAVKAGASTVTIQFTRDGAGVPLMTNTFAIGDLDVTPASVVLSDLTPHPSDAGRYMVTATPPTDFEGNVTVSIKADAVTDLRGNKNPTASVTTRVDSTPPTVAISGPEGPANGAVDATITFSEPVTGFEADDLTVSGGTAGEIAGSGAVYTVTLTPEADYNGELTVDVAAEAAADVAGNMSTAAEQYAVTIDQTPPTVTVTGPEGPIREDAEKITITFSEDVGDSFTLEDIVVGNGTASELTSDADTKGLYTAMVQADEGFEGMLTVDIAAGAATDLATNENTAAEQYSVEVVLDTTFTISLSQGLNLIHVPVKDEALAKVSDLYTALGGSSDVAYILSYVPADESFAAYIGIPGSSGDTALSDQSAVIVSMRTAKDVPFTGGLLSDTVSLTAGINLIGVPRDGAVMKASEVAPGAAAVLVLTSDALGNAQFSLVIPDTPTDVAASGGQGYIVVAAADDSITYTGEAWKDPEVEDGSSPTTTIASADAVKYDPTSTPVLLIEGLFAREDTLEPINGLSVSIKNLRTGESVVDTAGLTAGSGRFVKPMLALRGDSYEAGDAFEVSVVDPSGTFGGLTPVRAIVSKDEIAGGRIDIGRQLLSAVPDRTALLPNYPNPFNPETWIPFDLSKSSQVTVTVYNAAGQTVRVLELGQLPAGQYRSRSKAAYWDGRNALGERVSSGLYFYRIEAGSFSALRRMVILK